MNRVLRWIALLCLLGILALPLNACASVPRFSKPTQTEAQSEQETSTGENPAPELIYSLTESDRASFLALLDRVEQLILTERSTDEAAINEAIGAMEDQYYHIATQSELAYIYYCMNEASETKSEAYLFASAMLSDVFAEYQAVCLRIDQSDAPYREAFFADWSEEDLEEMRGYSKELTALVQANDALLVQIRSLSQKESKAKTPVLYLEMVGNNQKIAELNGYDNYAAYAYEKVYRRDYTPEEAKTVHTYVKSYLVPICERVYSRFETTYRALNRTEKREIGALISGEYTGAADSINGYLATYPAEVSADMKSLFEGGNLFYTNSKNADEGAFTAYLYEFDRPVCFFGPGYHSGYTVIHELGHYYAALISGTDDVQMDLAETQSQGNEWLFTDYLVRTHSETFAEAIVSYQLYSSLASIVLASIVDEFEQGVYANPPASAGEFDQRMNAVCDGYGGREWLMGIFADPLDYWRGVAPESPCYYISYAYSMLISIGLYCKAQTDPESARETYLVLAGGKMGEATYPVWLRALGLETPFDESLYQAVAALAD